MFYVLFTLSSSMSGSVIKEEGNDVSKLQFIKQFFKLCFCIATEFLITLFKGSPQISLGQNNILRESRRPNTELVKTNKETSWERL